MAVPLPFSVIELAVLVFATALRPIAIELVPDPDTSVEYAPIMIEFSPAFPLLALRPIPIAPGRPSRRSASYPTATASVVVFADCNIAS